MVVLVAVLLAGAVLAAVQHAEVVAHRVGEPFGSLVLAVAVTVIEVSLIVTLMLSGGDEASTLARETVFAAVMITVNGILGVSLLIGARRFGTVRFNAEGTGGALGHRRDPGHGLPRAPDGDPGRAGAGVHRGSSSPSPRSPRSRSTSPSW